MNLVGYARVSTTAQSLDAQTDALEKAGAIKVYSDHASGATMERPGWVDCLAYLQPGNVLLVNDLTRLGRSAADLASIVTLLAEREIGLRSLNEPYLDTSTSHGLMIFQIFSALAEYERNRLRERTLEGLQAAKARGRVGGRPTKMTPDKAATAHQMRAKKRTIKDIAALIGVSESTVVRELARERKSLREEGLKKKE
ncbi:recombinase family protein [Arthrobacter antibioticus]|uniref:recombinase family protein n=1 Tax=Arthrobacter sp. H35-MC1 TaxID=3046203 RepID=UPI0024BAAE48|nr:recombinase family protein [Arthrobacter sp. H35-MC1]MDJ0318599.1 recombinase family protein [Arthrobacter sp. H35-MC1]